MTRTIGKVNLKKWIAETKMTTEDFSLSKKILKEAEKLTQKEYSWWKVREPEQLFGNEIISLTRAECEKEIRFLKGRCFNWKVKYDKQRAEFLLKEGKIIEALNIFYGNKIDVLLEINSGESISEAENLEMDRDYLKQKIKELSKEVRG